jgi:type VI secretion system secreted protein Hcp
MALPSVQQANDPTKSRHDYEIHLAMQGQKQGKITGESQSKAHYQEIEVSVFTWGVATPTSTGLPAGKPSLSGVTITKSVDRASINIINASLSNECIKTATISWSKSTGFNTTEDFFTVTLTNAYVTSIHLSSGASGDSKGMGSEVVTLSFQKIDIDYKQQTAAGLMQAAGSISYSIDRPG